MNKNKLKGKLGDESNAVLAACGFKMRKLLKAIFTLDYLRKEATVSRRICLRLAVQSIAVPC